MYNGADVKSTRAPSKAPKPQFGSSSIEARLATQEAGKETRFFLPFPPLTTQKNPNQKSTADHREHAADYILICTKASN